MVLQMGYIVPPWQSLQLQRVPSAYQQDNVASEQVVPAAGGTARHAGPNGGVVHDASGAVMCHVPSQRAVVRHWGRGSSPQLQCALAPKRLLPASQGGVHAVPSTGGADGHMPPGPDPPPPVVVLVVVDAEPVALEAPPPPPPLVCQPQAPQATTKTAAVATGGH